MSISTLQEKFFNKGCGATILGIFAAAMAVSMYTMRSSSSSREDGREDVSNAVVTVGNVPVPASLFQSQASELASKAMQDQAAQMKVSPERLGSPDASVQAMAAVRAVGLVLQRAAIEALVTKAPVTEDEIAAVGAAAITERLDKLRQQLVQAGQLKPTANDADFEKAIKKELNGKTIAQVRADSTANLLKAFKDPQQKAAVISQFGGPILVQRLGMQQVGTDEALKESYKTYVVRRIFLSSTSGSTESPEARAAKAEADLKAGKSFESVMDAMSNDPAPTGKKPHDVTETVASEAFASRPELASLKDKAANATTGVVDVPGGKAIYQVVSVRGALPPDFEKNKASLRAAKALQIGQSEAEKQIKAFVASDQVKWNSPGYKALSLVADATAGGFAFDPAAIKKATDAALAALKSERTEDRRLAAQALIVITDPKTVLAQKSSDTVANRRTALEAAQANGIEDTALSLELADLYGNAKDGAKAAAALIAASKANDDYGNRGQQAFGNIASRAIELQKKGVLTKDQLAEVQAQQAVYTSARAENEKLAAQAKAESAKEQASNEAEIARQKAEASKSAPAGGSATAGSATDNDKANAAEIARQKAEASKKPASGGSLLQTTTGGH